MSYPICTTGSNSFKVKNEEKFVDFMNHVYNTQGEVVDVFTKKEADETRFAFGSCSKIIGYIEKTSNNSNLEDSDDAYEKFVAGLQDCVADGEAIIVTEANCIEPGRVYCLYWVITKNDFWCDSTDNTACHIARSLLHDYSFNNI